jgi:hypothetical protein
MTKSLVRVFALALFIATVPLAAQTTTWTAIASTGAVDEASLGSFAVTGPTLSHNAASLTDVVARYNITDVSGTEQPGWTTLEMSASNATGGMVRADLYQVDPCGGDAIPLCIVFAQGDSCRTCTFSSGTFDFANYLYYVEVKITRPATINTPSATAFRLY